MARARWAVWSAAMAVGGLLFAAATAAAGGPEAAQDMSPAFARGAAIAQARCSSCHGVALEATSPVKIAPLFRVLSRLYSADDLETKLSRISETGHFEMPAVQLREDQVADLAAYIAGLDGGSVDVPDDREKPMAYLRGCASPAPQAAGLRIADSPSAMALSQPAGATLIWRKALSARR